MYAITVIPQFDGSGDISTYVVPDQNVCIAPRAGDCDSGFARERKWVDTVRGNDVAALLSRTADDVTRCTISDEDPTLTVTSISRSGRISPNEVPQDHVARCSASDDHNAMTAIG